MMSSDESAQIDKKNKHPIRQALQAASHYLPAQSPLHAFVHHNTLHAFESLDFEDALLEAANILDTEPYWPEERYAEEIASGRITATDLDFAIADELNMAGEKSIFRQDTDNGSDFTWRQFIRARMQHIFPIPEHEAVDFLVLERDLLRKPAPDIGSDRQARLDAEMKDLGGSHVALKRLWDTLIDVAPRRPRTERVLLRRRGQLKAAFGEDGDALVRPLLMRVTAAFLDQGIAYWKMPKSDKGLLVAFRDLYQLPGTPPDRIFQGLEAVLRKHAAAELSAEETIAWALEQLQISPEQTHAYIEKTLLALPGWAGMVHRLEHHPDLAPVEAPKASLLDYLAVQLTLDTVAAKNLLRIHLGENATFSDVENLLGSRLGECPNSKISIDKKLVWEAFILVQHLPLQLSAILKTDNAAAYLDAVQQFSAIKRRSILQRAYERHHVVEQLDGIKQYQKWVTLPEPPADYQAVFCIDDREESLRRHLEEVDPHAETFGFPGFFGVVMYYRGADASLPRPLCPAVLKPKHLVEEIHGGESPQSRMRPGKELEYQYHVGRTGLIRGLLASLMGSLAILPWISSTLFRGRFALWRKIASKDANTELLMERHDEAAREDASASNPPNKLFRGFTTDEMTDIGASFIIENGLNERLAEIVLIVGHGSTSVNNPHVAAYGCGATAGGCGGPNARVLARMLNKEEVRNKLKTRNIHVPETTYFVGAMHNTATDIVEYYDVDQLPSSNEKTFRIAKANMEEALVRNAIERARLFSTIPLGLGSKKLKKEVELRAFDLSEARPEYNHAKNSMCIVGRRQRTRGLFLDQRAFLVSYDPTRDDAGETLASVLRASLPVCAGINLEYFFSTTDAQRYGAGSKLPHNITGLIGVMDGHASDLRTGLYEQMVELHEPIRLITVIEAEANIITQVLDQETNLRNLVTKGWIILFAQDPESGALHEWRGSEFIAYNSASTPLPEFDSSLDYASLVRQPLPPARIRPTERENRI